MGSNRSSNFPRRRGLRYRGGARRRDVTTLNARRRDTYSPSSVGVVRQGYAIAVIREKRNHPGRTASAAFRRSDACKTTNTNGLRLFVTKSTRPDPPCVLDLSAVVGGQDRGRPVRPRIRNGLVTRRDSQRRRGRSRRAAPERRTHSSRSEHGAVPADAHAHTHRGTNAVGKGHT